MGRQYHIIGACSCWGAQIRACERGPEDLVEGKVFERLQKKGISIQEVEMLYPEKLARTENIPLSHSLPLIQKFNLQLMRAVQSAVKEGTFPIVLGGDHSVAVGTWNAFDIPFGLLWIDAHLDAHTPKTTPSGAYHGMPVAALLGEGAQEMAELVKKQPVLKPQNLVYIGARSFEEGERELLKRFDVKIYFAEEVEERGLKAILPEAIAHVARGVSHYGVSLDLDVFPVEESPGVGSPEEGGISKQELLPLLSQIGRDPRLLAFELVEFNPEKDIGHTTRELAYEILYEVMK
jgi:arginase